MSANLRLECHDRIIQKLIYSCSVEILLKNRSRTSTIICQSSHRDSNYQKKRVREERKFVRLENPGFHPRRRARFTPSQARRGSLPPFEFALMFSIKSKRHSDGGRCARNPNRGHKPPKGSARIAAKCLSSRH